MNFNYFTLAALLTKLATADYSNVTLVTVTSDIVVTEYTTYCPVATTIVNNNKTITVTGPTTLTITDCPCTIKSTYSYVPTLTKTTPHGGNGTTVVTPTIPSTGAGTTGTSSPPPPVINTENNGALHNAAGAALVGVIAAIML